MISVPPLKEAWKVYVVASPLVELTSLRDQSVWMAKKGASQAWKACSHSLLWLEMKKTC